MKNKDINLYCNPKTTEQVIYLSRKRGRPKKNKIMKIDLFKDSKDKFILDNKTPNSSARKKLLSIDNKNILEVDKEELEIQLDLVDCFNDEKTGNKRETSDIISKEIEKEDYPENEYLSNLGIRSVHNISPKFKKRNALLNSDFFSETEKLKSKSQHIDKITLFGKGRSVQKNIKRNLFEEIEVDCQKKLKEKLYEDKSITENKNICFISRKENEFLNKTKEKFYIKNNPLETETCLTTNYSLNEAINDSKYSYQTPYFNDGNFSSIDKNDKNMKTEKEFIFSLPGSFICDIPKKVTKLSLDSDNNVFALINWKERYDGSVPDKSFFPLEDVQQIFPDLLCKFFVKKFKWKLAKRIKKNEI